MVTHALAAKASGGVKPYARQMGVAPATVRHWMRREAAGLSVGRKPPTASDFRDPSERSVVEFPHLPDKHQPIETILERLAADTDRRNKREIAEKWFPIKINDDKPIGILWFGDPHLGTSTNWPQLLKDVKHCAGTKGLYGANLGDTTNNWVGRLIREYAEEDISRKTERRLAKWFLADSKIPWLIWLMGNHDEWQDGADILRLMNIGNKVPMVNWSAKFELHFPGKRKIRVHAAHDFPGHSMWNVTHAPARATRMMGTDADLFICGHRHDWGIQQFEMAERGQCPVAIRARGYKRHDFYAKTKGFQESTYGASILTIIDPSAEPSGRVLAFADTDQGVRVLRALRGETAARTAKKRRAA
jgi:hypothetical protein